MAIRLDIDAEDLKRSTGRLHDLERRISDPLPLMDEIGASLVTSTQHRFEVGRGPDGTVWKQSRRAVLEGGQTLRDSGRLEQSITHAPSANHVAVGTNVVYAGVHQTGGTIQPKSARALKFSLPGGGFAQVSKVEMPARPFLGVDDADEREIGLIVNDYIAGALK